MRKKLMTSALALLVGCWGFVQAQQVTVSPIPQQITWGEKAFDASTAYTLVGEATADADAVAALKAQITTGAGGVKLTIGERGDAAVAAYEAKIPSKAEGYYLEVKPGEVVIAGADGNGTFYGVQTFLQIASKPEVMSATVTDYPDVEDRGVVEGFYGNPWSHTDRLRQFDFYGANKMNVYIYGPKDDPYHRARWRENYPPAEGAKLAELVEAARKNKVQFVWAIHPGEDIKWNATDSANIVKKFQAMYDLGVRTFAVFFDDVFGGEGTRGDKQAMLMNYINDEFVKKHEGAKPLILCPTQYNKGWSGGDYLPTLGSTMDKSVRIMWTGNSVVDMINESDMNWINNQISRNAYIWLNYPVNDYCIDRMLMGPTYGNDKTIASQLSGFTSNPMEYAEASMVSLYSIADYSWNLSAYEPNSSWERAIEYLMPEHKDAFRVFCENNIDLGATGHGLRRDGESPHFKAAAATFESALENGEYTTELGAPVLEQFNILVQSADELLASTATPELSAEIKPWVEVMKYVGQRGQKVMALYEALQADNKEAFVQAYEEMLALEQAQKAVISRNFEGSIKKPNPTVAGTEVAPFLKKHAGQAVRTYKQRYNYRLDLFPVDLVEEGRYYIKCNGMYLTDRNANPDRVGDYPVFQAEVDNINPQRQEWNISIDPATERYKITNAQDGRYINEKGSFWANKTNNPYDAAWHTYTLYRMNGKYAIQNAGSAGNKFWTMSSNRINSGNDNQIKIDNFIFEFVPVGEEAKHPAIDADKQYYIVVNNQVLTNKTPNTTGGNPIFTNRRRSDLNKQTWHITPVDAVGRYKITSVADDRYLNELGNFGNNAYSDDWNTYIITEKGGLFSIQCAGQAGNDFWIAEDERIGHAGISREESYLFAIVTQSDFTDVESAMEDESGISFRVDSGHIHVTAPAPIVRLRLVGTDGKTLRSKKKADRISIEGLKKQPCVLVVKTKEIEKSFKIMLP